MKLWLAALAAAVAFSATPAQAGAWRWCMTVVKDGAGADRIILVSDNFDEATVPGYAAKWEARTRPVSEAALRQYRERGSVVSRCSEFEPTEAGNRRNRELIMGIARRKGLLIQPIGWPDAAAMASAPGRPGAPGPGSSSSPSPSDRAGGTSGSASSGSTSGAGTGASGGGNRATEPLRRVGAAFGPPPTGYSPWKRFYSSNANYMTVEYATRAANGEVRVIWRCTNESDRDQSCSIGAGGGKEYQCWKANESLGSTRMPGERATVRSGQSYSFPGDWACRGTGATSTVPVTRISIER